MKTLLLYPIYNQAIRIQPLFRNIEQLFDQDITECIFLDEGSQDESLHILNLEITKMEIPYKVELKLDFNRADSLSYAIQYGVKNGFDHLVVFNEGWEDNIEELVNIIRNKEFKDYGVVTSCRHVYKFSLGSAFNLLSNILVSLTAGQMIRETKGDSINIINLKFFSEFQLKTKEPGILHLQLLIHSIMNGGKLLFSDVDNGLNFKSFVKLNTLRTLKLIKYLIVIKIFNKNS
ncbi:MAG: hypothetical protein ACJAS4_002092 [Bacteriovoracaceae bacterium]|jgi:hypothetical protein